MFRLISLFCCILLFASFSKLLAQRQRVIDSLKNLLIHAQEDSNKVNLINRLWAEYLYIKPTTAKTYLEQALALSQKIKYRKGEAYTTFYIGTFYYHSGNYVKALEYYDLSETLAKELKDKYLIGNILSSKGLVYYKQGTYVESLNLHLQAMRLADQLNDTLLRASSLNNIGLIHEKQADINQAKNYFQQALLYYRYIKKPQSIAYVSNNIARILREEGKLTDALYYYNQSLAFFEESEDLKGISEVKNNIGSVYIKQGKYSQAWKVCRESLEIRQKLEDKSGMANSLQNIAIAYRKAGLFENALNYALQSYQLAQELGLREIIKESSFQLAEIYAFHRDYQKAFEYYQIYDTTKDSLYNETNIRQLAEMRTKYEAQTKEQEINALRSEQRAQNAELEQKNIINYGLIAILMISLVFLVLIFNNYNVKKKANIALEEKNIALNEALIQLKSTQSQLIHSEKMASLGQLTAGIAHEINNPLNFIYAGIGALESNIYSFYQVTDLFQHILTEEDNTKIQEKVLQLKKAETLKEYEDIKEEINLLIKDIKIGAVRTTEIVKGLRNFSRLDEGKPKIGDIHNDIDAALMLLRNKLAKNITVSKKYGDKIPEIAALHGQINQVFTNIIANAIQAMENGGKITITTKLVHKEGRDYVSISIKDTGSGMSESVKAKIFEPFFTTKDIGEGTGLGLSISYGIIRNHKGTIEVFSEIGKGTEFVIYLPVGIE
ncbi:MAG: hypothetical protein OHK0057_26640 [Thermoflexibacter sp.]